MKLHLFVVVIFLISIVGVSADDAETTFMCGGDTETQFACSFGDLEAGFDPAYTKRVYGNLPREEVVANITLLGPEKIMFEEKFHWMWWLLLILLLIIIVLLLLKYWERKHPEHITIAEKAKDFVFRKKKEFSFEGGGD